MPDRFKTPGNGGPTQIETGDKILVLDEAKLCASRTNQNRTNPNELRDEHFPKRYTQRKGRIGAGAGVSSSNAIGAPARPARSILWVSLLAATPRVTIARAGELVMGLPAKSDEPSR